jgi:hypothetical protein
VSTVAIPPVTANDGQPCANCRAPLAGDQRYCLQCGTRRADAAGTSLESLVAASAPGIPQTPGVAIVAGTGQVQLAPAPVAAAAGSPVAYPAGGAGWGPPPERPRGIGGWISHNGPFLSLGTLAVGVLIVGLLLGHWSSSSTPAPAPTTTKIEVSIPGGLGATAAAPAASSDSSTDATSSDASKKAASSASATPVATPAPLPKNALKANDLTPAQIDKAAKKGKTIVTTGKTVPKDNKPAGGGSATVDIG